jgi:hypothetical protein
MAYLNSRPRTPEVCPVCGEDVPPKSLACPECGSDHNTGWKESADTYDGVDVTDRDDFDYDEFVEREFGENPSPKPAGIKAVWWVTAIVLLIAFLLTLLGSLF